MSLELYLLNELLDELRQPRARAYDQNLGLGLLGEELLNPRVRHQCSVPPMLSGYLGMRPRNTGAGDTGATSLRSDKNEFRINLDVQQFKPDELKVKVVDNYVVVEAKHEERSDQHGFISRQFTRRYKVPEGVNIEALASSLSSDGVLTLRAPKKAPAEPKFREIPITHTNAPAVQQKAEEQPQEEAKTD